MGGGWGLGFGGFDPLVVTLNREVRWFLTGSRGWAVECVLPVACEYIEGPPSEPIENGFDCLRRGSSSNCEVVTLDRLEVAYCSTMRRFRERSLPLWMEAASLYASE